MPYLKYHKLIRTMKITLTLLIVCVSGVFAAEVNSQSARVNISMKNVNLRAVRRIKFLLMRKTEQSLRYYHLYLKIVMFLTHWKGQVSF